MIGWLCMPQIMLYRRPRLQAEFPGMASLPIERLLVLMLLLLRLVVALETPTLSWLSILMLALLVRERHDTALHVLA